MLSDTLSALLNLLQIVQAAAGIRDKVLKRKIRTILRTIYFTDDGILELLETVYRGDKVSKALERKSELFLGREPEIALELRKLNPQKLFHDLGIAISTSNALQGIVSGKLSLRRSIRMEMRRWTSSTPDIEHIGHLIALVKVLNAAIADLDEQLSPTAKTK